MMKSVQTRKKNEATFPKRFLCSSVQYILHTMYVYNITLLSVHIHQRVQSDIMLVSPGIFNSGVLTSFRVQSGRFPFFFFHFFSLLFVKWQMTIRRSIDDDRWKRNSPCTHTHSAISDHEWCTNTSANCMTVVAAYHYRSISNVAFLLKISKTNTHCRHL